MEPKDLNNSEELKTTKIAKPRASRKKVSSNEVLVVPEVVENQVINDENNELVQLNSEVSTELPDAVVELIETSDNEVITQTEAELVQVNEPVGETEPEIEPEEIPGPEIEPEPEPESQIIPDIVEPIIAEEVTETVNEETNEIGSSASAEPEMAQKEEIIVPHVVFEVSKSKRPRIDKIDVQGGEPKKERVDYSQYSQIELVNALREVLEKHEEYDLKEEVDAIKSAFYKEFNDDLVEQKRFFVETGGKEEEFVPIANPYEDDIKEMLEHYRHIRTEFNKQLEAEKEENLKNKYQIIEEIKGLLNNEESINRTFQEFRELQRKWREIGLVPQSKMKDLWETYHFHVENFYDFIKINKELRDLDLRKNLELKIELCELAEELIVETSVIKAFNNLQKYHEQWREIGPVPNENKDDIWERFKTATAKINKKHQDYFEDRKSEQKQNLDAKIALCEKVEQLSHSEIDSHKEWDDLSKELVNLQQLWRTIGFAPKKENNKVYERFRTACDSFFDAKRDYYSKNKESQQTNLQMKIELCLEAETLKDSNDWKKATQDLINIQKKWKEIGPVPRKQSDLVWKRFRAACDFFFEKKAGHFSGVDNEQSENLRLKEELIAEVVDFKSSGDVSEDLNQFKAFQRRWTEIGHVPIKKKDEVQARFREAINKLYDSLKMVNDNRSNFSFRNKMSNFNESSRGQGKMRQERERFMIRLKQLESDLTLLENNVGFFAKSKNAEALIVEVNKKIESTKKNIEELKEKIRVIDDLDKSE